MNAAITQQPSHILEQHLDSSTTMPPAGNAANHRPHVKVRDELLNIVVFKAMDALFSADSMKKEDQWDFVRKIVYGHAPDGILSSLDALCAGEDEFECLYEADGNMKVLKKEFYVYPSLLPTVKLGDHITFQTIGHKTFSSNEYVQGRALLSKAKKAWLSIKKILSVYGKHFDVETGKFQPASHYFNLF